MDITLSAHTKVVIRHVATARDTAIYTARNVGGGVGLNHPEVKRSRAQVRSLMTIVAELIAIDAGADSASLALAYEVVTAELGLANKADVALDGQAPGNRT